MSFRFEPLAEQHLELLADWLSRPHVTEWWGKPPSIGELRDKYLLPVGLPGAAAPYIAFLEDEPVGYIQSYVAMDFGTGWWPGATDPTVRGIDQFLADGARLGQGLGARMIRAFTRQLFSSPEVTKIVVDPAPTNQRAIRCYRKAGFREAGPITTPDGAALLMLLPRPDTP